MGSSPRWTRRYVGRSSYVTKVAPGSEVAARRLVDAQPEQLEANNSASDFDGSSAVRPRAWLSLGKY